MVEHQIVALGVVGSNPITHPIFAPVAQLDRARASGVRGQGFESSLGYHAPYSAWQGHVSRINIFRQQSVF